jgi:hypothetical protein
MGLGTEAKGSKHSKKVALRRLANELWELGTGGRSWAGGWGLLHNMNRSKICQMSEAEALES